MLIKEVTDGLQTELNRKLHAFDLENMSFRQSKGCLLQQQNSDTL